MVSKYQFNVTSIHFPQKTTYSPFFLNAINLIMRNELINKWTDKKSQKSNYKQKQPPEVFCKKKCSYKFRKIHRKTPLPGRLVLYKDVYYQEFKFFFWISQVKTHKNVFLFKVTNENIWTMFDVCSKLTIKTSERRTASGVFIVDFEQLHVCWDL